MIYSRFSFSITKWRWCSDSRVSIRHKYWPLKSIVRALKRTLIRNGSQKHAGCLCRYQLICRQEIKKRWRMSCTEILYRINYTCISSFRQNHNPLRLGCKWRRRPCLYWLRDIIKITGSSWKCRKVASIGPSKGSFYLSYIASNKDLWASFSNSKDCWLLVLCTLIFDSCSKS